MHEKLDRKTVSTVYKGHLLCTPGDQNMFIKRDFILREVSLIQILWEIETRGLFIKEKYFKRTRFVCLFIFVNYTQVFPGPCVPKAHKFTIIGSRRANNWLHFPQT